jgi:protein TonB
VRCTENPEALRFGKARRGLLLWPALALAGCAAPRRPVPPSPPAAQAAPGAPAVDWPAWKREAARRIVATSPGRTYGGRVPDPLLAIPVLEIDLEADGRVRAIRVLRRPTQATDTIQLAIDAVRRAAPFAAVRHLPRPWTWVETFLFDDDRRFQLRTLDVD